MKYCAILDPSILDDDTLCNGVVAAIRKTPGVLKVDDEMANNGLVLFDVHSDDVTRAVGEISGVERVTTMGVKHAI